MRGSLSNRRVRRLARGVAGRVADARGMRHTLAAMEHPTIDVVIPVHGGWEHTQSCLRHLARQTVPHTVVLVDNASPDDTVARTAASHREVRIVEMKANAGFSRAVNAGVAAGDGELIVALNNDVDCEPEMLERLAAAFEEPSVGSAAPVLLRPGGELLDAYGIAIDPTLAGFVRLQGHAVSASEAGLAAGAPPLLGPYGAAAAYRRAAYESVGGLDERIFMYGEELDLALRLAAAGWRCAGVPQARGTHLGGATSGKRSAWQRHRGGFARGYLLRRYGVLRTRRAPRALAVEAIVVAGDLLISRDAEALRGRVHGWRAGRGLPRHAPPPRALAAPIGFAESLRLRVTDYTPGPRG
jgi:GT2 family glycosyltransferase